MVHKLGNIYFFNIILFITNSIYKVGWIEKFNLVVYKAQELTYLRVLVSYFNKQSFNIPICNINVAGLYPVLLFFIFFVDIIDYSSLKLSINTVCKIQNVSNYLLSRYFHYFDPITVLTQSVYYTLCHCWFQFCPNYNHYWTIYWGIRTCNA